MFSAYSNNERNNSLLKLHFIIEDDLRRYEERLVKDENVLKKVLEHEVEATKIMRDFQNYANFTYKYETMISAVSGASDADAQYFSRRLWRARKVEQLIEELNDVTTAMYTDKIPDKLTRQILENIGISGLTNMKLIDIRSRNDTVTVQFQTVVGDKVTGTMVHRKKVAILTSPDRMYLVRTDFTLGNPIGIREVRMTGPISSDCGQLVNVVGNRYMTVTGGELVCTNSVTKKISIMTFNSSETILLTEQEECHNDCINIGRYRREERTLDTKPVRLKGLKREQLVAGQTSALEMHKLRTIQDRINELTRREMLENKQMMEQLGEQETETGVGQGQVEG